MGGSYILTDLSWWQYVLLAAFAGIYLLWALMIFITPAKESSRIRLPNVKTNFNIFDFFVTLLESIFELFKIIILVSFFAFVFAFRIIGIILISIAIVDYFTNND